MANMWHFSETPRSPPEKQKWVFQLGDLKCLKPNTKAGELKLKRAELLFLSLQILEKTGILKLCGAFGHDQCDQCSYFVLKLANPPLHECNITVSLG